jgi:hypothetical protein
MARPDHRVVARPFRARRAAAGARAAGGAGVLQGKPACARPSCYLRAVYAPGMEPRESAERGMYTCTCGRIQGP